MLIASVVCVRVILRAAAPKPQTSFIIVHNFSYFFPSFPLFLRLFFDIYATRLAFRLLTLQEPLADREFSSYQLPTAIYHPAAP